MIVQLKFPIEFEGAEITKVTLRRPNGFDVEAIERASADGALGTTVMMKMISVLSGLSMEQVGAMDFEDIQIIGEKASDFFGSAFQTGTPPNGEVSSPTAPQS